MAAPGVLLNSGLLPIDLVIVLFEVEHHFLGREGILRVLDATEYTCQGVVSLVDIGSYLWSWQRVQLTVRPRNPRVTTSTRSLRSFARAMGGCAVS